MTDASLPQVSDASAVDEQGLVRQLKVPGEVPLTLYLDRQEILTLMTLGTEPERLVLGYLSNQGFIESLEDIQAVQVDWSVKAAAVVTRAGVKGLEDRLRHRTVTSGCGQGTLFGNQMEALEKVHLPPVAFKQSQLYTLLGKLARENGIYREAGAVHGCALCRGDEVIRFVEDVGRHNAVDILAGEMLLEGLKGERLSFYTTGRLTSEMVIKVARMGIPVLFSRSGVTRMGLDLAQQLGLMLIGRAKGRHYLVFEGAERLQRDGAATGPVPTSAHTPQTSQTSQGAS